MKIFGTNLVDLATLTVSSEAAALPGVNLANAFPGKVWRTGTALEDEYVVLDFGESKPFAAVILHNHDFTVDDNLRFIYSDAADFADAIEQVIEWQQGTILAIIPAVEARYFKLLFSKDVDDTRQLGRLYVGPCDELADLPDHKGFKQDPRDMSKTATTIGGQDYSEIRPQYQEYRISGSSVPQDQVDVLAELASQCGQHTPFFIQVQDPLGDLNEQPLSDVLYVRFKDLSGREHDATDTTLRWKVTMDLKEFI